MPIRALRTAGALVVFLGALGLSRVRAVFVKIRIPRMRHQIDSDMRTLRAVVRLTLLLAPGLGRL